MKLLIVLSVTDYKRKVIELMEQSGVNRFSISEINGYKKQADTMSWFASQPDSFKTESILLFSFTSSAVANKAIESINRCNESSEDSFPVHGFILDVENFSKLI